MELEQKLLFTEYEEIKRAIKELEAKADLIKPQLLELIPDDSKIDSGTGIFSKETRQAWKFSEELTAEIKEIEEKKEVEKQTGVAEAKDSAPFIVFRSKE